MKRIASVVMAVALVSVGVAAVASAHFVATGSNVSFHLKDGPGGNNVAKGKVRSHRDRCEEFRTVEFYRVNDGAADDDLVDATTTNANGEYKVKPTGPISEGRYYAKAVRVEFPAGPGHSHVCKRAFSNEQVVVGPNPIR
jgi:hypothetical protein